jgi:hypothetical protein
MTIEAAVAAPERMHLVDLRTGEDRSVFFNPEQLEEQLSVNWAKLTVPGLSHQVLHYVNTNNHALSLDLYLAAHSLLERQLMEDYRRFLLSLCYSSGAAGTIAEATPPRVLLVWPELFSMTVVLGDLKIRHARFAQTGASTRYFATISIEEIRDVRLTSEDVRRQGTRRSSSGEGESAG